MPQKLFMHVMVNNEISARTCRSGPCPRLCQYARDLSRAWSAPADIFFIYFLFAHRLIRSKTSLIVYIVSMLACNMISTQNILLASEENKNREQSAIHEQGAVPEITMTDMNGKALTNTDLLNWIAVYTFGDRKSNEPLIEAVYPVRKLVLKDYPTWNMAYVNIADLHALPNALRYIIDPVFRQLFDRGMKRLKEDYKKEGLVLDESHTRYYLIPDYTGDILKAFKLKHAKHWHCYITYNNKIYATLDDSTCDFTNKFIDTLKLIADKIESEKIDE